MPTIPLDRGEPEPALTPGSAPSRITPQRRTSNRYEYKYFAAAALVPRLVTELAEYVKPDEHAAGDLGYRVFSVYWDTSDWLFYRQKIEGVKYRRKLRFRRYGDGDRVYIEVKQREDRTLQKRRLVWPAEQAGAVFGDGTRPIQWDSIGDHPVATEVALMIERLRLKPRMGVLYRRRAFVGAFDPELRITLDGRIQYAPAPVDVARPFETGRYVLDPRVNVMEIKYDHRPPKWLIKLIGRHGLKMVRMSKYCSAVDRHCFDGQNT